MATRFYFPPTTASAVNPAFSATWNSTTGMVRRRMRTTKNGGTHVTQTVTENVLTNPYNTGFRQYVSDPINTASAITGTIKFKQLANEILATADAYVAILIRRFSGDGATDRGTMLALTLSATELTTSSLNQVITGTLTSITGSVGDRIVVEVGAQFQNAISTNASARLEFGDRWPDDLPDNTTFIGAGGNTWLEFSATIPFVTDDVARFYLGGDSTSVLAYPTTPAAILAPTTFTGGTFSAGRLARRDRATPNVTAKTVSVSGGTGDDYFRGIGHVTDFLAAQTVPAGTWTVQWTCQVSSLGADTQGFRCVLFVVKPDGTKRADIGTTNIVDVASTSGVTRSVTVAAGSVLIENQDRILVETEIYDASTGTYNLTLSPGLNSFLLPPQTLLLGSSGPAFQAATQFDLDGYDNHLSDMFVPQDSPTRTMEFVTKVKNRSGSVTGHIRVAIYSNLENGTGQDFAGSMIIASDDIPVAPSFSGEKRVILDLSMLTVGVKYHAVVCYDDTSILSVFYDTNPDVATRGCSFTGTYGTWPTNPTGTYYEQAPDYTYVSFHKPTPLRTFATVIG